MAVRRASLGKVTVEFVDGPMNDTERDVLAEARADPDTFEVREREVDHLDTAVDVDGDSRDEGDAAAVTIEPVPETGARLE